MKSVFASDRSAPASASAKSTIVTAIAIVSTTVIKEREPRDSTTVIKKEDEDGNRSKTVIHHDN